MRGRLLLALAGQPNCGKSTVFNGLTGARQHVANYPGVTVDKKTGFFSAGNQKIELVDLPGTYSLASYSLEERVARDFLLHDSPQLVINVLDASNLKRSLYLTVQLLEMEMPLLLAVNMMDVAERRSIDIDLSGLSSALNTPAVPTIGTGRGGVEALRTAIGEICPQPQPSPYRVDYKSLEPFLAELEAMLAQDSGLQGKFSFRWLAVKLFEADASAEALLSSTASDPQKIMEKAAVLSQAFEAQHKMPAPRHIAFARHRTATELSGRFVIEHEKGKVTLSDQADKIICHRVYGPVILLAIMVLLYQIAIVFGNFLAAMVWPFWEWLQALFAGLLPDPGFLVDPMSRSLGVWVMKSMTAILNYLPIFFLLFACIAILEDSGYMPRMAFILDRLFRRFGLHGQSTLPLILGGVYVGGCAIPAVMATKAIPDEKARLATILIAPMMNCLAKVPLYLILISTFFPEHSGSAMFFMATVTMLMALPVSKVLSLTVLKGKESAPFIMEMPPYHLPTVRGILARTVERVWLFIKKIVTVVLAVAIVIFALITFPGPSQEYLAPFQERADSASRLFLTKVAQTGLADTISEQDITGLFNFDEALREAKRSARDQAAANQIDSQFEQLNPGYFAIVRGKSADGKILRKPYRDLGNERKQLRRELKEGVFEHSLLGMAGKALVPVTQFAGFNWKVNIALLSAFAAKENSAATLGAIYGIDGGEGSVQEDLKAGQPDFTPLHALALMLFMALYPPCIPTSVMVRMQAGSTGWMLFSILYQTVLGLLIASLVFTGGTLLGLSGLQAMWIFYGLCLTATIGLGMVPSPETSRPKHVKQQLVG